ncbi:kelch-like protein 24 isoform X2 [Ciona intestinalis]
MDELPAMKGLDMETLTHELPAIDGSVLETTTTTLVDEVPDVETMKTERLDHASYNETLGQQPNAIDLPESTFMIVGGWNTNKLVQIYDINRKSFKPLKSTLYERDGSTIVKINNHVYTAGGLRSNFVECLDLNQVDGDWYKLASMNEQRQFAASAVLNDQMCVAGGSDGVNALSSVELYNPVVNIWTNIASMQTKRWQHALVSYNGRLYTFGGGEKLLILNHLNSMKSYDPREENGNH